MCESQNAFRPCITGWKLVATILLSVFSANGEEWKPEAFESLPAISGLPGLLTFQDGRRVTSADEWSERRAELKAMLKYYEYGQMPPPSDFVVAEVVHAKHLPDFDCLEERMTLVIDSVHRLRMDVAVYVPNAGEIPFPVIVREEHALGHLDELRQVVDRGYMFVEFEREDLDPDQPNVIGAAQSAYPDHDWATLAVWAWGAMRVVDYLESRRDVDADRIVIAGHSRGGKTALLAGAMDERFAMVAANGAGCGGSGCFRIDDGNSETLEAITRPERFGYWFHRRLRQFAGRENRLPVDQHFLKALVAPRALICTDARGDTWANPEGNRATSRAAQSAFELLGAADKNALHFRDGAHDMTAADWTAILDFADWHLRGQIAHEPERFRAF